MLKNQVITELKKLYADDEVQIILRAVLQNSIICDELNRDGIQRIVSAVPRPLSVSMWNSALIALVSQGQDINLIQDIKTKTLKEINPDLATESLIILDRVFIQKNYDPTLKDALYVALFLNEQLNKSVKINDLFNDNAHNTNIVQDKFVEFWACVFACLINFQNAPCKMLGKLIFETSTQEFVEIVTNAILSNPQESQELISLFIKVFSNQKLETIIHLLNHLNNIGWQKIIRIIAKEIISIRPELCLPISEIKKSIKPLNWIDVHSVTQKIQQIALLNYYAGMIQEASSLFEFEKEILGFQNEGLENISKEIIDPQNNMENYDDCISSKLFTNQEHQASLGEIKELLQHNQVNEAAKQITGLKKFKKANPLIYRTAAEISYELGDFSHALDEISTSISIEPNDVKSKLIAGRIYHTLNENEKGLILLQSDKRILEKISNSDLYLYLDIATQLKEYETVISICEEKIKEIKDGRLFSYLAEAHIGLKRNIQAMNFLKKAIEIDRGNPRAWLLLTGLEVQGGEVAKAIEALLAGLKYCPNSLKLHIELIKIFMEQNNNSSAKKYVLDALEISPENISEVIELADLVIAYKHIDDALIMFNKAIQRWPRNKQLKICKAELLIESSRFAESQVLLRELIQTDEFDEEVLHTYFFALIGSSKAKFPLKRINSNIDIPEIKKVIAILQRLNPESLWIKMFHAEMECLENNIDETIKIYSDLLKGLGNNNNDMRWRFQAGMANAQTVNGEFESAIALLNEIENEKKDLTEIYFLLTYVYEQNGLINNAYENAIKVIERFPLTQKILSWFRFTLIRIGKLNTSIDDIDHIHLNSDTQKFLKLILSCDSENIGKTRESIDNFLNMNTLESNQAIMIANELAQIGDVDKAIEVLSAIQEDGFKNNTINFFLACLLRKMERPLEAMSILARSSNCLVETYRPYFYLELAIFIHDHEIIEEALLEIGMKPSLISSNLEELLDSNDFNSHLLPESWRKIIDEPEEAFVLAAEEYYKAGNLPKSLELFKKAQTINPENIKINWLTAEISKLFLLDAEEVNSSFNTNSIECDEKQKEYLVNLSCLKAEIAFSKKEDVHAASIISKILPGNEENLRIKSIQARLFYREGDLQNANKLIKEIETSIAIPTSENKLITDLITDHSWLIEAALDLENWEVAQKHILLALNGGKPSPYIILMTIKYLCQMEIINDLCNEVFAENHLVEINTLKQQLSSTITNTENINILEYPDLDEWNRLLKGIENLSLNEIENIINYEKAEAISYILRKINKNEEFNKIIDQFNDNPGVLLQASLQKSKNNLLESVSSIDKTISINPNNPICFALKAVILEKNDKTEEALIAMETALSFWPNEPEWHAKAAKLFREMRDHNREVYHLESAFKLDPNNSEIRKKLLHSYFESGDLDKSAGLLINSGDISTRTFEESMILAEINLRDHLYKDAYELGMEAIRKEPESSQPYILFARMAIELKNQKKALEYLEKIFLSSPHNKDAHLLMAKIIEEKSGVGEALKYLDINSQEIQDDQRIIVRKADYIKRIRGVDESIKYLMQFEKKGFPDVLSNLALMEIELGYFDKADLHAQNSLKINSGQPILLSGLGTMHSKQGNLDKSLKYYLDVLNLEPKVIEHYIKLSEIFIQRREKSKATEVLKQGMEIFPKEMRLYQMAGEIFWDMKDYQNAEEMFRYAAEINPNDDEVQRQLGSLMSINLIHQKQVAN